MKRLLLFLFVVLMGLLLGSVGCGGNNNQFSSVSTAIVAKRAFLLNQFGSAIHVIDAAKDVVTGVPISISQPEIIVVLSNKTSLVYSGSTGGLTIIDNATQVAATPFASLSSPTESIVVTPDAKFAYAALPAIGKIAVVDLVAKTAPTFLPPGPGTFPGVRRLVMTKSGTAMLAFADNSDSVTFVDIAGNAALTRSGFDRPYSAVLSSDDTKAYVLNCGLECGGVQAGITPVDLATKAAGSKVNVKAATVAIADATNLYVAGTDVTTNQGQLTVVALGTLTPSPTVSVISDGLHTTMGLGANSKLYIGSKACTNSGGKCLSVFDIGKSTGTIISGTSTNPAFGDVQAITPIKGRNVVYIIQNGVIQVYDTTTDLPQANPTILVSGKVVDVKEVD